LPSLPPVGLSLLAVAGQAEDFAAVLSALRAQLHPRAAVAARQHLQEPGL